MDNIMGHIYKITNLVNNKIYIGKRVKDDKNYLGSGTYIKRAVNVYGKENFKKEILEENIDDKDILAEREKYWIAFYNSTSLDIGYNLSKGGDGGGVSGERHYNYGKHLDISIKNKISSSNKGKHKKPQFSAESISKRNQSNTGKNRSKSTKEKISSTMKIVCIGENNGMFGKTHTDENKKLFSSLSQGRSGNRKKTSKYVGVSFNKSTNKWASFIIKNKKQYYLGSFFDEEAAALAYNRKAIELYGSSAKLNFIGEASA